MGLDWRLLRADSLPSTSDLCRARAEGGEPEGFAVLARRQENGRGSRGRTWESPAGNLFLSVLLRPPVMIGEAGHWSLLAGLALAEALGAFLPNPAALTLKWPNDVLLHGRKLAGILTDSAADEAGRLAWLAIGLGANLAVAPQVAGRQVACLAELGPPPSPDVVAESVLARIGHWHALRLAEGFAPVRAAWLARALPIGGAMAFKLNAQTHTGAFAGLDAEGNLLLQSEGRVRAFATGEVLLQDRS